MSNVKRIFVEKKKGFDVEAQEILRDLQENLKLKDIQTARILYRYDVENIEDKIYHQAKSTIFAEPPVDLVYEEVINVPNRTKIFGIEYLPGQYDQRADSAAQAIQILTQRERPEVKYAKIILLTGDITEKEFDAIKKYLINPVDSREASFDKPDRLKEEYPVPEEVQIVDNFIFSNEAELSEMLSHLNLAMDLEDLKFCQKYFKETEKRNPTITEIKILDTYWSDHCRHTTFLTCIENVEFEKGKTSNKIEEVYEEYLRSRKFVYEEKISKKNICLMDIATIAMKELKKKGQLNGFDESEEINACSIKVKVDIEGSEEDWLVMFKNETHNHPTEIEPFGGAATCLGGAIRDPLSGRAFVYQAMRVTGSADPRLPISQTMEGKLPQRKITTEAAHGYSSYGNQIGLSTGLVNEIYHPGYVAKRMEIGAVIAATPEQNVVREKPKPGDIVILLGGKTGRDGCGGATGSSKAHDEESIIACGAEVQKGNAPEERKIQRLFRDGNVTRMIKRCNDFGAGGISVAVGELAEGLEINLNVVPKKYEGLDGTELAISESQERMACVVAKENEKDFKLAAQKENLEATTIAVVTESKRIKILWRDKHIVDISRGFLDSNGATKNTKVKVTEPMENTFWKRKNISDIKQKWFEMLGNINTASQKGLVERFDSCVGASTVNYPFGGKYQLTPIQSMVAKIPSEKETTTGTIMSYGYNPVLSFESPFHGAVYAVVDSVSKIIASGGNYKTVWFSFQEYFERLSNREEKWGKPFASLLGAFYAQKGFNRVAIGGKDSMSGSFKDINVPPTLVSFAVDTFDLRLSLSPEFKKNNSVVINITVPKDENSLPNFEKLKKVYDKIIELNENSKISSIYVVEENGIAEAVSKMCFGNKIGFEFDKNFDTDKLFDSDMGGFVIELSDVSLQKDFTDIEFNLVGKTITSKTIKINNVEIDIEEAIDVWTNPLENIFPTKVKEENKITEEYKYEKLVNIASKEKFAKPRVLIPVFPGTNSEYDSIKAFEKAGALAETIIVRNLTSSMIDETVAKLAKKISNSQIVFVPGGFSAGDEPEGSGKFIASIFRNPLVSDAVNNLLKYRDGLMLGICNGFQALIKLGLVPYGEITTINENSPTLTFNKIGRHVSKVIYTKVVSHLSPWFANTELNEIQAIPVSHGEGRFYANSKILEELKVNGQIATQYVDFNGKPTMDIFFNPNGSLFAVEGLTSLDGKVLGKMGHNERLGNFVAQNIPGNKEVKLFSAGVNYFK